MNSLRSSRGMALTVVIFVVSILLTLTGTGLIFSGLDLKTTSNVKVGTIALQVADSGVQHAVAAIPPGLGFNYPAPPGPGEVVVPSTNHPSLPGFSYSVKAVNADGGARAVLTSTALGPNGTKKVVVAYVARGGYALGSIYAPGNAANIETGFSGSTFTINGNDNCTTAPAPRPAVPGISTTDPALVTEITNNTLSDGGLASNQMGNVTGAGGTPSVVALQEPYPTVAQLTDQYIAQGEGGSVPYEPLPGGSYSSNENWGTAEFPRITRITGAAQISGTIEGYGVLIVDDTLAISGNFTFHGVVISRGDIEVQVTGNAGIFGSLLLDESMSVDPTLELDIRGNATIRYDSCAIEAANQWVPLPQNATLVAWQESFL